MLGNSYAFINLRVLIPPVLRPRGNDSAWVLGFVREVVVTLNLLNVSGYIQIVLVVKAPNILA